MKPPTVIYKRVGVPPASAATSRYNVLVDGKEVGWVERVPRLRRGYGRWSGRPTLDHARSCPRSNDPHPSGHHPCPDCTREDTP